MYSFIGSGSIWPDPLAEISIVVLIGLSGPKPASARRAFAASGSYLRGEARRAVPGIAGRDVPLGLDGVPAEEGDDAVTVDREVRGLPYPDVVHGEPSTRLRCQDQTWG